MAERALSRNDNALLAIAREHPGDLISARLGLPSAE
jgi:hypothetical protein